MEDVIGTAAGILTSIAMVPQLLKVIKEKNVEDISGLMLGVLISGLILWIWYGIMKGELPIILSNSFAVLVNLILAFYLIKFKK